MTDYTVFYAKSPGKGYVNVNPDKTHYDDKINGSIGHGNSRKWGDASFEVQQTAIDAIITTADRYGLGSRDIAHVLAIAYQESGFNPDAAAGTTTASGLGQFIDKTGRGYGLNDENRFDIQANAKALVEHFIDNKNLANKRGQGEEFIYKYHHDGPSQDYGGLALSKNKVIPLIGKFEAGLNGGIVSPGREKDKSILDPYFGNTKEELNLSKQISSPIVLDFDGDGVKTTAIQNSAYFDHASDGFAERTGWIGAGDGLLARDLDGDGLINTGMELFGSETRRPDGSKAANGFEALKILDSNHDGQINANDPVFSNLIIWMDADRDGYSRPEELFSLQDTGVVAIATNYTHAELIDPQGNAHRQIGTYTRADGSQAAAEDIWFAVNLTYSLATTWVDTPKDIAALPDLAGYGTVRDLRQAMALDVSGALKAQVAAYTAEPDEGQRHSLLDQIIYTWTGVEGISPTSRGSYVDARQLAALEKLLGERFYQPGWGANPGVTSGKEIGLIYDHLTDFLAAQLDAQTRYAKLYAHMNWIWDDITQTSVPDLTGVITDVQAQINISPESGLMLLDGFARNLKTLDRIDTLGWQRLADGLTPGNPEIAEVLRRAQLNILTGDSAADKLDGDAENNYLLGFDGNDTLNGQSGNDVLEGGAGSDTLEGGSGNDFVDGGAGNDLLDGNAGTDIYLFKTGFGQDHIHQYDSASDSIDTAQFIELSSQAVTQVIRQGDDLILMFLSGDRLTVDGYFESAPRRVDIFEFADGVRWEVQAIKERTDTFGSVAADVLYGYIGAGNRIYGQDGNDELHGNSGNDALHGGLGDDLLYGQSGDDFLDGNAGNDTLKGGAGNDSYVVDSSADIVVESSGAGSDSVQSSISYQLPSNIEHLTLVADAGDINGVGNGLANQLIGNNGNNALYGGAGADTLSGGGGVDSLTGGAGADIFELSTAAGGADCITDFQPGIDLIRFNDQASGLCIGDQDGMITNAVATPGSGGFAALNKLVIITESIVGQITAASAAIAIGAATEPYTQSDAGLFIVNNRTDSAIFYFTSSDVDKYVHDTELILIGVLQGIASTTVQNYAFSH